MYSLPQSYNQTSKCKRCISSNAYFNPVGSDKVKRTNVRIISATNENMKKAVEEGRFREDLYYRLAELEILQPPLKDCKDDILPLAVF